MILRDGQGNRIELGNSFGRGGEAIVYRINGQPTRLAKIYDPAPRPNYQRKLAWMIEHPPTNPTIRSQHDSLAWPDGLLYDMKGQLKGYSMPFIRRTAAMLDVFNPRRRAEILPMFDWRYLHRVARNLSAALGALHSSGYVAGDLNESNVLVTSSALVTLIDADLFQVTEVYRDQQVVHPCPVGKLEYTPPELQGKHLAEVVRRPEHDGFALGVLIFQLLMNGSHPFRAQWLGTGDPPPLESRIASGAFPYTSAPSLIVLPPKNAPDFNLLHPWLVELVRRCFVDGYRDPALRPSPQLWESAIAEAERVLMVCSAGHVYSSHLGGCPYCVTGVKSTTSRPTPGRSTGQEQRGHVPHTPFSVDQSFFRSRFAPWAAAGRCRRGAGAPITPGSGSQGSTGGRTDPTHPTRRPTSRSASQRAVCAGRCRRESQRRMVV